MYYHKVWPNSAHYGQIGYTPNMGTALKDAGAVVVRCKGNIGPSQAPVSVSLANKGRCPEAWGVWIMLSPTTMVIALQAARRTPVELYNKGIALRATR